MKMYLVLREWCEIGMGVDTIIIDSPHQNKDYAPYIVEEFLKNTPIKQMPLNVLKRLEQELIDESEPSWYVKVFEFIRRKLPSLNNKPKHVFNPRQNSESKRN